MRGIILSIAFVVASFSCAFAQLVNNGFYRVQNKVTQRYIRVIDNKGSVNLATTDADLGAMETVKPFEKIVSDPASIIYIESAFDSAFKLIGYNLKAQGTSSYSIIKYYVKLYKNSDGSYRVYAQDSGLVKYLNDENTTYETGVVLTNDSRTRDWWVLPMDQSDKQCFALTPDVAANDEYYATIYASFPFTITSGDMKAYYIDRVANGQAVWKEVTDGKVPASTAVLVKCASSEYLKNKVIVENNGATAISENLLSGVYFNNGTNKHNNQKTYDSKTMRVLGVMSDGNIGFVTANYDYLPANKAYLVVPENSPSEIKLVSEEDFSGIEDVIKDVKANRATGVYTITGVKVGNDDSVLNNLSAGFYIVNGKKVIVK